MYDHGLTFATKDERKLLTTPVSDKIKSGSVEYRAWLSALKKAAKDVETRVVNEVESIIHRSTGWADRCKRKGDDTTGPLLPQPHEVLHGRKLLGK